jgi:hypothetical protein
MFQWQAGGKAFPSSTMATAISPWTDSVYLISPDGKLSAEISDAMEVGMGAPTHGTLQISNGMSFRSCNPSIVWSDDSRYLAVPQWTRERDQRLLVISVEERSFGYAPGTFSVLELHSFSGGKIKGIDSPVYRPSVLEIEVGTVQWA